MSNGKRFLNWIKPAYDLWMKFAAVLAWINTRLILIAMFYLVFTPIGLIMRLFGSDQLGLRIEKDKRSYWVKNDKMINYERQF
jgi:uncharacterized protein involved in cysteine biosynthesis